MASFPAPHLERRRFQTLPAEGTPLTEAALLQILYDLLKPLEAVTYVFCEFTHTQNGEGEISTTLVQFIQEILEQAVELLEAWHEHQEAEVDDAPEDAPPPGRRRERRRNPEA